MKKAIIMALLAAIAVAGCTYSKIQVIDGGTAANNTNTVMKAGFADEQYIWESFQFPTNRVK